MAQETISGCCHFLLFGCLNNSATDVNGQSTAICSHYEEPVRMK